MKTYLRLLNIMLAPILTVVFAEAFSAEFAGRLMGKDDVAKALGAAVAGAIVLAVELILGNGPKYSRLLRRWFDSRAIFEGVWLQEVVRAEPENRMACMIFAYKRDTDSYRVTGNAYTEDAIRWTEWKSNHMFFTPHQPEVAYLWEGSLVDSPVEPEAGYKRHGLTTLSLRESGPGTQPVEGKGSVSHLDKENPVDFTMLRVTDKLLRERGLNFDLDSLLLNEHQEERALIVASLSHSTALQR